MEDINEGNGGNRGAVEKGDRDAGGQTHMEETAKMRERRR